MIWFVGAGPGDPELITVKGRRLLEEADVVVYAGSLVPKAVLGWTREGCELHDSAGLALGAQIELMSAAHAAGKQVVRLHTGDPSLYGAIGEQMRALDARGIDYAVVPGVSSFVAAAAALPTELTAPGVSQTVIITRQPGRTPVPEGQDMAALAAHRRHHGHLPLRRRPRRGPWRRCASTTRERRRRRSCSGRRGRSRSSCEAT